jgi:hypothetical protein
MKMATKSQVEKQELEHLTVSQRNRIKQEHESGKTVGQLGRKYGVKRLTVQKVLGATAAFAVAAGIGFVGSTPQAEAVPPGPNTCVSGGGGFIGFGSFRDCDLWADGSFYHEVFGGGPFAFGGSSGRVCDSPRGNPMPPATDWDPNTICPGW